MGSDAEIYQFIVRNLKNESNKLVKIYFISQIYRDWFNEENRQGEEICIIEIDTRILFVYNDITCISQNKMHTVTLKVLKY